MRLILTVAALIVVLSPWVRADGNWPKPKPEPPPVSVPEPSTMALLALGAGAALLGRRRPN